jgi:glycosyltransferase involved in cell wall biosynthesis
MGISPESCPVEVVVSTYQSPKFLNLVLCALSKQTVKAFSVCVADDGSGPETLEVIHDWQAFHFGHKLRHVWQDDEGFRKNRILNRAIATSHAEYLIFIDGDCLASRGFLARHLELAQRGRFVSGGLVRMPLETNDLLNLDIVSDGSIFGESWLLAHGGIRTFSHRLKAGLVPKRFAAFLELVSPVKRTWNGCNASAWSTDLRKVNGFNESMRYGAEDVELGVRLNNVGVRARHCRYTAPLLHMEHGRSYAHAEEIAQNQARVRALKDSSEFWSPDGIKKTERCHSD